MKKFDYIIIGAGITGASVAHYLHKQDARFAVVDDRLYPPGAGRIQKNAPSATIHYGDFNVTWQTDTLVLSPGLAPETFAGYFGSTEIIGDIELFVKQWHKPIIAITGTNGKSTLVSLIAYACQQAGVAAIAVGNIGVAALDALESEAQIAVLEVSSFQLLTTKSLRADIAVILNITPDHLDRHGDFMSYKKIKQRIFLGAKKCITRADDPMTEPPPEGIQDIEIHRLIKTNTPKHNCFSIVQDAHTTLYDGTQPICTTNSCALRGAETAYSLLTAYVVAQLMGFPLAAFVCGMQQFTGLPHRMQRVAVVDDVEYINDSKATNIGATVKALESLNAKENTIILLGGDGKNADFTALVPALARYSRLCVLYGTDERLVATVVNAQLQHKRTHTLNQALTLAHQEARPGDIVLLSPACASFDQFNNFVQRGKVFSRQVRSLAARSQSCA